LWAGATATRPPTRSSVRPAASWHPQRPQGRAVGASGRAARAGDARTAADTYTFLEKFVERFPAYAGRPLWVAGESYGGHYVRLLPRLACMLPSLACMPGRGRERAGARRAGAQPGARDRAAPARRARRPAAPQPAGLPRGCAGGGPAGAPRPRSSARAERRGCRAGNAWTDAAVDNGGAVDFWWSHAMISDVRPRPRPQRARSPSRESDQRGVRAGDARGRAQDVQFQQHRPAAQRAWA